MGKHLDRANVLLDLDKYEAAERELRQEIAEHPDSDIAHGSLARCFINQRKLDPVTLETLDYALSLNAENDWLHYLAAVYWHMKGEFDQGEKAIGIAIELDPNTALYFDTLARILLDRGNDKFTTHNRRVLLIIFIFTHGALLPIGWAISATFKGYWLRSYLRPVLIPLEKSLSLDPEYLSALNLQTLLLIQTHRWHRALDSSLNALHVDPNHATTHQQHAQILLRLGKYPAAVDHFQSSLRIDPSSKESKAGLLESIRSQYRIYPWISITNWRGKIIFIVAILIMIVLLLAVKIPSKEMCVIFPSLLFIPVISVAAKPIFNLFLQFNTKYKLLMRNLISTENIILTNYVASLIIAFISLIYFLNGLTLILGNPSVQYFIAYIAVVIAGIIISAVTFLPLIDRRHSRSLAIIYQLIVGGLGLVNIGSYLSSGNIEVLSNTFFWLVFLAPVFASFSESFSRKSHY